MIFFSRCAAGISLALSVDDVINQCPQYTFSRAWRIGNAVFSARECHSDPVQSLVEKENAMIIIAGKVCRLMRVWQQIKKMRSSIRVVGSKICDKM